MRKSRFDWSVRVVKNSVDSCLELWFDSNAQEMTTAEHCMYLTKFCELLVFSACGAYSSGEFNHNKATTFEIYKSWNLHYSNSTRT